MLPKYENALSKIGFRRIDDINDVRNIRRHDQRYRRLFKSEEHYKGRMSESFVVEKIIEYGNAYKDDIDIEVYWPLPIDSWHYANSKGYADIVIVINGVPIFTEVKSNWTDSPINIGSNSIEEWRVFDKIHSLLIDLRCNYEPGDYDDNDDEMPQPIYSALVTVGPFTFPYSLDGLAIDHWYDIYSVGPVDIHLLGSCPDQTIGNKLFLVNIPRLAMDGGTRSRRGRMPHIEQYDWRPLICLLPSLE